jgi:hypothetical protein
MKKLSLSIFIAFIFIAPCYANLFVDWRGGFYVNYPNDWFHVNYQTVSKFLLTQGVNSDQFDYDAVLAQKSEGLFFNNPYIFIVSHPMEQMNQKIIDSVIKSISEEHESAVMTASLNSNATLERNKPIYDKALNAIAIETKIVTPVADKVSLDIRKFHDKGMAQFLCYSPRDMYEQARPIFLSIVNSFSTKDIDKMAPPESLKVVDLADRKDASNIESDIKIDADGKADFNSEIASSSDEKKYYILILAGLIIGAILIFAKKRKK